ncbi:MAG: hypothetical protein KGL15_10205 [Acidobacteriota bacterium]|nr:hypothetical protein [Acidobacteriota bacterium]
MIATGVAIGLLASLFVAVASGHRRTMFGKAATVHSNGSAKSISATVYVSAIYCGRVGRSHYAGQRAGVELLGKYRSRGETVYPLDFSGYYSYCSGNRPVYTPEFLASNPRTGLVHFKPSGFKIAPGDPLKVSVVRTSTGVVMTIYDVNTNQLRTWNGPPLGRNGGWSAGALELFARPSGKPFLTGYTALLQLYSPTGGPANVPGPVPWAPIIFTHLTVNKHIVGKHWKGLSLETWRVGPGIASARAGHHVTATVAGTTPTNATVTPPSNGTFESNDGGLPPPTLGKTVDITPVSGNVQVQSTGHNQFKHVPQGIQVPNNSQVDARNGSVQMTLALPHGNYETGIFYDGLFQLHQNGKSGATTATLTGGGHGVSYCPAPEIGPNKAVGIASAARTHKPKKGKKLRSLWANAHGSFTTKGSGGAAAVLGTRWLTEDTCDGTWFKVVRDKIKVTAYYPHRHTVLVTAGHSYFAPNKFTPVIKVSPVTTSGGHFNVRITHTYRLTVISEGHPSYVDASVVPNLPGNGTTKLFRAGSVDGVPRWYVLFNITPNLINFQYWNIGVKLGHTMYLVRLRVHG